jgi:hypothetical protein
MVVWFSQGYELRHAKILEWKLLISINSRASPRWSHTHTHTHTRIMASTHPTEFRGTQQRHELMQSLDIQSVKESGATKAKAKAKAKAKVATKGAKAATKARAKTKTKVRPRLFALKSLLLKSLQKERSLLERELVVLTKDTAACKDGLKLLNAEIQRHQKGIKASLF